jgi:hypothetical protein
LQRNGRFAVDAACEGKLGILLLLKTQKIGKVYKIPHEEK